MVESTFADFSPFCLATFKPKLMVRKCQFLRNLPITARLDSNKIMRATKSAVHKPVFVPFTVPTTITVIKVIRPATERVTQK